MNKHVLTEDGSSTIFSTEFQEHYHSMHGAVQESRHVFIEKGLREVIKNKKDISIFEVGLGTGLNVLLTLLEAGQCCIEYTAIEAYPLEEKQYAQLNFDKALGLKENNILQEIHASGWNQKVPLSEYFTLHKVYQKLEDFHSDKKFDLIYFDAFSPNVQPQLWTDIVFTSLYKMCKLNAVLVTYCAKGNVRRSLISAGFTVEKLAGPPGKREMIRAVKV